MAQIIAFITKHTSSIIWVLMTILVVTQALAIEEKKNRITEMQSELNMSRDALRKCNGSLEMLKVTSADEKKKSIIINTMLTKCYNDMEVIRQGRSEIDSIMDATDDKTEEQPTEKKEEVNDASISIATNKLGISFINKQFSSIEQLFIYLSYYNRCRVYSLYSN